METNKTEACLLLENVRFFLGCVEVANWSAESLAGIHLVLTYAVRE